MAHDTRRRAFLIDSSRAALGFAVFPRLARAQGDDRWEALRAELEKQIPALMKNTRLPGLGIAIVKDGAMYWRRGFGVKDAATKARVDNRTVFQAGSVSKPVFAYVVMKLHEQGVLNLDTPLTKYTPDRFLQGDSRLDLVTARHVLSHTSGFQNWRSQKNPLTIHFTPGERYRYSGEGYSYLQSVVTHLTGRVDRRTCSKFEDGLEVCATDIGSYLKANLLTPFGMTSSGYVWNAAFDRVAARGHDADGRPFEKGTGGTATDAARYASARS